jgi:hypothetical protein
MLDAVKKPHSPLIPSSFCAFLRLKNWLVRAYSLGLAAFVPLHGTNPFRHLANASNAVPPSLNYDAATLDSAAENCDKGIGRARNYAIWIFHH